MPEVLRQRRFQRFAFRAMCAFLQEAARLGNLNNRLVE